jgi:hypothetical protein
MNTPFFNRICSFIVLIAITTSCSSNLDFNQKIEELSPNFEVKDIINQDIYENLLDIPITVGGLIPPPNFIKPTPILFNINEKLVDNNIIENIKKVKLHMTFPNTINQKLTIQYDFVDGFSNSIKTGIIIVDASDSIGKPVDIEFDDIEKLKSVEKIQFEVAVTLTGSTISRGKLSVKSDATVYLKL